MSVSDKLFFVIIVRINGKIKQNSKDSNAITRGIFRFKRMFVSAYLTVKVGQHPWAFLSQ